MRPQTLQASAALSASKNIDFALPMDELDIHGLLVIIDITAVTGTSPTMTLQLQHKDPITGKYVNLNGAVTPSLNSTGTTKLTVHPAVTTVANQVISETISENMRAVITLGGTTPNFTCSISAQVLK